MLQRLIVSLLVSCLATTSVAQQKSSAVAVRAKPSALSSDLEIYAAIINHHNGGKRFMVVSKQTSASTYAADGVLKEIQPRLARMEEPYRSDWQNNVRKVTSVPVAAIKNWKAPGLLCGRELEGCLRQEGRSRLEELSGYASQFLRTIAFTLPGYDSKKESAIVQTSHAVSPGCGYVDLAFLKQEQRSWKVAWTVNLIAW